MNLLRSLTVLIVNILISSSAFSQKQFNLSEEQQKLSEVQGKIVIVEEKISRIEQRLNESDPNDVPQDVYTVLDSLNADLNMLKRKETSIKAYIDSQDDDQ